MIISHKYRFIFIKTAKTAGTSIEVFLSKQCGPADIVAPIFPLIEGHEPRNYKGFINPVPEILERPHRILSAFRQALTSREKFFNHMPASLVKKRVSTRVWNSYFKFCVERNPWDKVLSHYHMHAAREAGVAEGGLPRRSLSTRHSSARRLVGEGGSLSLDEYLARGRFPINLFRYTDDSGTKIIVDRVLRYENLVAELSEVFSQLNVPFEGTLGISAKSEYRTDRRPYQLVFNDQQRRIVENAFAREIELHGYRFEP
jgi:hypothetical protein